MAGLYLHVPFCSQRCTYCDFYFVTTAETYAPYVRALLTEIEHYGRQYGAAEPIETIYFGGGTPSLLHPDDLFRILDAIREHFDAAGVAETTFELNPEDASADLLRELRRLGVDRLSIGVQSFFDDDLRWMNRAHSSEQAERAVRLAQEAGFDNFSIDLIFGLPDQPFEYWGANLEKAVRLGVPHLSTYGLTVEPKTVLANQVARGLVTPSDEDTMNARYRFTLDYLRERGYEAYEISSFARPGRRAVHNARYWEHRNYLGLGPSAHTFWWHTGSLADRWANVRNLRRYEALLGGHHVPTETTERLDLDTLANEYVMLRLRTADGLDLDHLSRRYGADLLHERGDDVADFIDEGWLFLDGPVLRLSDEGRLLADAITERLIMDL